MKQEIQAFLGMGTNLGDRLKQLRQAIAMLQQAKGIQVNQVSSVYQTSPVGYLNQPHFFNLVCRIQTVLTPMELLQQTQLIEQKLQRKRTLRWGPRTIDLDILLYGTAIVKRSNLTIPHPRMQERAFVLVPLYELVGDIVIPGTNQLMSQWMNQIPEDQKIKKILDAPISLNLDD